MDKDFHKTLGIPKTANEDEIKEAYERLALKYNPAKNKEISAEEKFKEISEAFEVLSDKCRTISSKPKLYTRTTVKSNHIIIQNALMKVLEGAVNADLLKKMQTTLAANQKTCNHFLILFRNRLQFRGLYKYDEKQGAISKLDGIGPKSLTNVDIFKYYKFDSPRREFIEVQTKHISLTIIAFTIHDHLWPKRPSSKPTMIEK